MYKQALINALAGVILNIVLAYGLSPFASVEAKTPPDGASKLGFYDQLMHMLVHHKQVPITSSLIIFALVFLSTIIGRKVGGYF